MMKKYKPMSTWNATEEHKSVCVAVLSDGKQIGYLMKDWNPTTVVEGVQCGGRFQYKSTTMKMMGYDEASKGDKAKMTRTYNLFIKYLQEAGEPPPPVEG